MDAGLKIPFPDLTHVVLYDTEPEHNIAESLKEGGTVLVKWVIFVSRSRAGRYRGDSLYGSLRLIPLCHLAFPHRTQLSALPGAARSLCDMGFPAC
jgi:hypothetical protein